jgi:hypothetical protein
MGKRTPVSGNDREVRDIQLQFICPGCGLEGSTPELTSTEAMGLTRCDLKLRCPRCHAILTMQASESSVKGALLRQQSLGKLEDTVRRQIAEKILKARRRELKRRLSETVESTVQQTVARRQKRRLANRICTSIEAMVRKGDFIQIDFAQVLQQLNEGRTIESLRVSTSVDIDERGLFHTLTEAIEAAMHQRLSADERSNLAQKLVEDVKAWSQNIR